MTETMRPLKVFLCHYPLQGTPYHPPVGRGYPFGALRRNAVKALYARLIKDDREWAL